MSRTQKLNLDSNELPFKFIDKILVRRSTHPLTAEYKRQLSLSGLSKYTKDNPKRNQVKGKYTTAAKKRINALDAATRQYYESIGVLDPSAYKKGGLLQFINPNHELVKRNSFS